MNRTLISFAAVAIVFVSAASVSAAERWKEKLETELPLLGHRNWIVIADSAYPWQTAAGIETINTGAHQLDVVKAVLEALGKSKHVAPLVYLDAELAHVPEARAAGIDRYRTDLKKLLGNRKAQLLPHEEIIAQLNDAGKTFHVLLLKTDLSLPYTTVFIKLDCAYWNAESEAALRAAMPKAAAGEGAKTRSDPVLTGTPKTPARAR